MIARIKGKLVEKKEQSILLDVSGLIYEICVPLSVLNRLEEFSDQAEIELVTYYYFQIGPSSGIPILIGFLSEVEREFFLQFIKVSGIGPRAAVKALNQPISAISRAIDEGDVAFLKTLPGIGLQRAKEVVAKLQGKVGRFGLIQDSPTQGKEFKPISNWQTEALDVLLQLQYKRKEALEMIEKALERNEEIRSTEELLNEIYRQKVNQ